MEGTCEACVLVQLLRLCLWINRPLLVLTVIKPKVCDSGLRPGLRLSTGEFREFRADFTEPCLKHSQCTALLAEHQGVECLMRLLQDR